MTENAQPSPDLGQIERHLHALFGNVPPEYSDGLIEIAFGTDQVDRARLFEASEIVEAAAFARDVNLEGNNVYVGMALRNPDAPRKKRTGKAQAYAAGFTWFDADEGAREVKMRLGKLEIDHACAVVTGTQPEMRVQGQIQLDRWTDDLALVEEINKQLAQALGTDDVHNADRVMRLGGTVSHPKPDKLERGYQVEQTRLRVPKRANGVYMPEELLRKLGAGAQEKKRGLFDGVEKPHAKSLDELKEMLEKTREARHWWTNVRDAVASLVVGQQFTDVQITELCGPYCSGGSRDDELLAFIKSAREKWSIPDQVAAAEVVLVGDPFGKFPAPKLPDGILPPLIEGFAEVEARNKGVEVHGPAMLMLAVAAAAIPDWVQIRLKVYEGWHEAARLWVALIGDVSAKKTPVLSAAVAPLKRIERQLMAKYREAVAAYRLALAMAEKDAVECEMEEPERPPQLIVNDTTIEAAGDVIAANPSGVLVEHDELSGWFGAMDKYNSGKGSQADRAFWLKAWNGGSHTVNRRGRKEPLYIPNLSACVVGGIQPDAMRRVIRDTVDDGLIQRLIPVIVGSADMGEDLPDDRQKRDYYAMIARLTQLGELEVKFSAEAQEIRRKLEADLHQYSLLTDLSGRLVGFIGKLNGYFGRIALTLHCCEAVDLAYQGSGAPVSGTIQAATACRADRLVRDFIIPHAISFYLDLVPEGTEIANARSIGGHILARELERFTFGDLTTNVHCCRKQSKDDVRRMVEPLEMFGWVMPEQAVRPWSWKVNAEVHRKFASLAEQERTRRGKVHALVANQGQRTR